MHELNFKIAPAFTATGLSVGTFCPSIIGEKSPPVIAIKVSEVNSIVGPVSVISSAASFSSLPTKILANRREYTSIAPEVITPTF